MEQIRNVWLYALRYALTRPTGAMLQVAIDTPTPKGVGFTA